MQKILKILNKNIYTLSLYARQIAGTMILFVVARYLSIYDFGLFTSYRNLAVFCFMFANLDYSNYILVSSKANLRSVNLKISLFLLNAILIGIISALGSLIFKLDSHLLFIMIIIRTFFDNTFFALILPHFQATKNFSSIAKINIFYAFGISIIALISYIFKLSLVKFLLLNISLGIINFVQCSYYIKINYLLLFNNIHRFIKMVDKSILAYIGVNLAYYLYSQIPSLYVSTFLAKNQAALYFSAYTIACVINLIIIAQLQKMMPDLIKNNNKKIINILNHNLKVIIFVTSSVFVLMVLLGKPILYLLYKQEYYQNAYFILLILMLGNIFYAIAGIYGAYMTTSGNQKLKIPMQLRSMLISIIGIILLNKIGIYAPALSYLCATIYIAYSYTNFSIKHLRKEL